MLREDLNPQHPKQGHYLPFPMSLLFMIWRFDSIKVAWDRKLWYVPEF